MIVSSILNTIVYKLGADTNELNIEITIRFPTIPNTITVMQTTIEVVLMYAGNMYSA